MLPDKPQRIEAREAVEPGDGQGVDLRVDRDVDRACVQRLAEGGVALGCLRVCCIVLNTPGPPLEIESKRSD
jgi:hypothetical protein